MEELYFSLYYLRGGKINWKFWNWTLRITTGLTAFFLLGLGKAMLGYGIDSEIASGMSISTLLGFLNVGAFILIWKQGG